MIAFSRWYRTVFKHLVYSVNNTRHLLLFVISLWARALLRWQSTMYWNRSYIDLYTTNKKFNVSGCVRRLMNKLEGPNVLWIGFYIDNLRNTKCKKRNIHSSISTKKETQRFRKLMQALNVRYAECTAVNWEKWMEIPRTNLNNFRKSMDAKTYQQYPFVWIWFNIRGLFLWASMVL